jgi:hypothetical protein
VVGGGSLQNLALQRSIFQKYPVIPITIIAMINMTKNGGFGSER